MYGWGHYSAYHTGGQGGNGSVEGGVTGLANVPRTVLASTCHPRVITDSNPFHSQKYPGLKDKLYGYLSHRLLEQEVQSYHFVDEETKTQGREGTCPPCHTVSDRVETRIQMSCQEEEASLMPNSD